ncbi:hypothetical protein [Clostridium isatidis]|uniref:hypothetical protein n=1 Tax=Clostridium isatidis TaxID=182773 RepID=UPI003AB030DD
MKFKELNITDSSKLFESWTKAYEEGKISDEYIVKTLDNYDNHKTYIKIRNRLLEIEYETKKETPSGKSYHYDLQFGIKLYNYLSEEFSFSMRDASNDGIWRFLSILVIPDVVGRRWGHDNRTHYYSRSTRIWLRSLWWFIYLCWQGNAEETYIVLSNGSFSTDEILNLVERAGRGYDKELTREIARTYAGLSKEVREKNKSGRTTLFRKVMKLNTSKCIVVEPALYENGIKGYVESLFIDLGVKL